MSIFSFFYNSKSTPAAPAQEVTSCPQLERAGQVRETLEQKLRRLDEEKKEQKKRAAKAVDLRDKMIAARAAISLLDKEVKEAESRLEVESRKADNLEELAIVEAQALDDFLDGFDPPSEPEPVQVAEPEPEGQETTLKAFKAFIDV